MPAPIAAGQRYVPGLDGLRALAVLAVVAFHLGFGWAAGGLLGVGIFFTLSGYLITDLLLSHYDDFGTLGLGQFWLRRARRLLPALFVMLVAVVAWVTLLHRSQLPAIRSAVLAALCYVSNWWLIYQHVPYFARFGPPSPLGHLWSLAVEEQFYLLWPVLLMVGLCYFGERSRASSVRPRLARITLAVAAVSALLMALLYHPGLASTRAYDGTDTRAFGLLLGAALAMVWPARELRAGITARARLLLDGLGVAGLAVLVLMIWRTNEYAGFLYRGGLVLVSAAAAVVVAVVVHPASRLNRLLGVAPLRWIGVRSYGIYLWHFPIIVLSDPLANGPVSLVRAGLQVTATLGVAAVSWRFVEDPIRRGALVRLWAQRRSRRWRASVRGWRSVLMTGAVAVLTTACVGMSTTSTTPTPSASSAASTTAASIPASTTSAAKSSPHLISAPSSHAVSRPPAPSARTTSCASVAHIGDSTSEGMVSADYLPNPAQRLDAQYRRVGARTTKLEISGGTSILETIDPGQPNAYEVAEQLLRSGFHGCWVLALGTNDTADVFVGSAENRAVRVAKMMKLLASQPVMWLTVKSLQATGPYSNTNMRLWNSALISTCSSYPNMHVYDWAGVVQRAWFSSDGIHYTSAGYAERASLIADALAHSFPAHGAVPGCVVH
jgi:peptidoglycan/LPS O-acetylase OafA/YrhL